MENMKQIPVYRQTGMHAREHGEFNQFRQSNVANIACRAAHVGHIQHGLHGADSANDPNLLSVDPDEPLSSSTPTEKTGPHTLPAFPLHTKTVLITHGQNSNTGGALQAHHGLVAHGMPLGQPVDIVDGRFTPANLLQSVVFGAVAAPQQSGSHTNGIHSGEIVFHQGIGPGCMDNVRNQ